MSQASQSIFMPEEANRKARELVAAILASRTEPKRFVEYFHEDGVVHVIGTSHDYTFSGDYRGRAQICALLQRIDMEVELGEHKILNMIVDGDNVAIRRSAEARHHGTSAFARLLIGNLLRLRDGRIAEAFEYVDTCWLRRLSGDED